MTSNAEKIETWRAEHPGQRLTMRIIKDVLDTETLCGANLYGANLYGANLRGANLRGADLCGANLPALAMQGLPSGDAQLLPTPDGWRLTVGCWSGTVDDLATLIAQDEDWPEARGAEVARRRPSLEALIALCRDHITRHPDAPAQQARAKAEWDSKKENAS